MANVFVLCTGRTGSTSFIEACKHITNYTAAHESKSKELGSERFNYKKQHIEADNRLIWDLGRLQQHYGQNALFIYLKRDKHDIAKSFIRRTYYPNSMFKAYCDGIKKTPTEKLNKQELEQLAHDFVDNMTASIELFLKQHPKHLVIELEHIETDFKKFWSFIKAEGDLRQAQESFKKLHNASKKKNYTTYHLKLFFLRIFKSVV